MNLISKKRYFCKKKMRQEVVKIIYLDFSEEPKCS